MDAGLKTPECILVVCCMWMRAEQGRQNDPNAERKGEMARERESEMEQDCCSKYPVKTIYFNVHNLIQSPFNIVSQIAKVCRCAYESTFIEQHLRKKCISVGQ